MTNEEHINRLTVMKLFLKQALEVCEPIVDAKARNLKCRPYAKDVYKNIASSLSVIDTIIKILESGKDFDAALEKGIEDVRELMLKDINSLITQAKSGK